MPISNAVNGPEAAPYLAKAGGTMTGAINMGSNLINAVTDPVSAQDAATKNYVDQNALNGTSVYAATTTNLTVTQAGSGVGATLTNAGAQAVFSLDGVNPPLNSNVLVKNLAAPQNEGIYTVTDVGSGATNWVLTRSTGYDTTTEINNTGLIIIQNGSTLAGQAWYNTATIVTVDTTAFNFVRFGSSNAITSVNTQMFTAAGAATYTPTTGMVYCVVEQVGGGGGGGGITGGTGGQAAISGGGAGGGYTRTLFSAVEIGANAAVTVGAGGAGGASGGGTGGTGGDTIFNPAGTGVTVTAAGGSGGAGMTESASAQIAGPGTPGGGTNGDVIIPGNYGAYGITTAAGASIQQDQGGASHLSANAYPQFDIDGGGGSGQASGGYGCGSNGRYSQNGGGGTAAGSPGADGVCIVTEFISS